MNLSIKATMSVMSKPSVENFMSTIPSVRESLAFFSTVSFCISSFFSKESAYLLIATTIVLGRSEEHTSELQSRRDLVCRLLLEKKKIYTNYNNNCFNITNRQTVNIYII